MFGFSSQSALSLSLLGVGSDMFLFCINTILDSAYLSNPLSISLSIPMKFNEWQTYKFYIDSYTKSNHSIPKLCLHKNLIYLKLMGVYMQDLRHSLSPWNLLSKIFTVAISHKKKKCFAFTFQKFNVDTPYGPKMGSKHFSCTWTTYLKSGCSIAEKGCKPFTPDIDTDGEVPGGSHSTWVPEQQAWKG